LWPPTIVVELGLNAGLVDEVFGRPAAEHDGGRRGLANHDVGGLDDVADDVELAGGLVSVTRLRQTHADG